jgi:CBS domain containing-hemolysin-like protein
VAGARFDALYGHKWIWAFSLVFTYLMLQFTEILPKTLGVRYNRSLAPIIGGPLSWLVFFFRPISYVVRLANRPLKGVARRHSLRFHWMRSPPSPVWPGCLS